MFSEANIKLAAQLYETRDAAKFMLGERWPAFFDQTSSIINDIIAKSPRRDLSALSVAKDLATLPQTSPQQSICLIAVAVEMSDPASPGKGD